MPSLDEKGRRHDVMEMEIKFKGKTEQLMIHFGDDPYAVALNFVNRNNLKPSSVKVIAQYIENTMNEFLSSAAAQDSSSPGHSPLNVATQASASSSNAAEATPSLTTLPAPFPSIAASQTSSVSPSASVPSAVPPARAESLAHAEEMAGFQSTGGVFSSPSISRGSSFRQAPVSASSVKIDMLPSPLPTTLQASSLSASQGHLSQVHTNSPVAPSMPSSTTKDALAAAGSVAPAAEDLLPKTHHRHRHHRHHQSSTSSASIDTEEREDMVNASRGSSTTTLATNLAHVTPSLSAERALSGMEVQRSRELSPHRSTTPERDSRGSFSLSTSRKGVEYEITRYRSDSLNYSSHSVTTLSGWTAGTAGGGGEAEALHSSHQQSAEEKDADFEAFASEDDAQFSLPTGLDAQEKAGLPLPTSSHERRQTRRESYHLPRDKGRKPPSSSEEDLAPLDEDSPPPLGDNYPNYDDDNDEEREDIENASPLPSEEEMYYNLKSTVFQGQPQASLKPTSHVMMMGKHKFSNANTASGVKASQGLSTPSLVCKTAHERLYINANVMKKKKEMICEQKLAQARREIQAQQYKVNRSSQRIAQSVYPHAFSQDYDVTKKLYEDGIKAKEKRSTATQRVQEVRSKYVYDWSCVQCGELASIPYTVLHADTRQQVLEKLYICKRCQYDNYALVYSQDKRPVNIGLMYNQEAGVHLEAKRMVTMEDDGRELPATENIHEYLYLAGRAQDKILKLNKMLYEEMHTNLPFRPQIPISSRRIVEKNIKLEGEEDSQEVHAFDEKDVAVGEADKRLPSQRSVASTSGGSAAGWKTATESVSQARLTGQKMKSYFSKPLTTRLNTAYTKAQVIGQQQAMEKKPPLPTGMGKKEAALVARLLGEVQEKEKRQIEAENRKFARDPATQQELFKPKVEPIPQEIYGSSSEVVRLDPHTGKPIPIWEKLVAKDEKLRERRQKAELAAMNKLLGAIQSQQVKALDSSNAILQASFNKNISELFKLLLVSNMIYHNATLWINGHGLFEHPSPDSQIASQAAGMGAGAAFSSSSSSSPALVPPAPPLPDAEELYRFAQAQEDFESKQVDLLAIDRRILINEVSTLLLDMQHVYARRVQKLRAMQAKEKRMTQDGPDPSLSAIHPAEGSGLAASLVTDLESFDAPLTSFLQSSDRRPLASQPTVAPASAPVSASSLSSYLEDGPDDDGTPTPDTTSEHRRSALRVCDLLGESHTRESIPPEPLLISYPTFVKLATYCMKRRHGPGTGYLFAPKKKPLVALQRKELEDSHATFAPSLDRNSVEILRAHGNSRSLYLTDEDEGDAPREDAVGAGMDTSTHRGGGGERRKRRTRIPPPVPIEDVLLADGERVQSKIEDMRQKRIYQAAEELTFKPFLHKPPKHIHPKYRGMRDEDEAGEEDRDEAVGSVAGGSVGTSIRAAVSSEVCFDDPSEERGSLGGAIGVSSAPFAPVDVSGKGTARWQTSEQLRRERYLQYTARTGRDTAAAHTSAAVDPRTASPPPSRTAPLTSTMTGTASGTSPATATPGTTVGGMPREAHHGANTSVHTQDTSLQAVHENSPHALGGGGGGAGVQSPHVALEDIYRGLEFDESRREGEDEDASVATPYTKSTISTKFSIDMPADQQHQQHDHMFKDVTPYIAQEQPLQAVHTNAIPTAGHISSHNASQGNLKNARSLASFSLKHSLSYSSCNSSVGSGSGMGVRLTRGNTVNSGFVSSYRSDSDESSSFRSGAVGGVGGGGESSAAGVGRAGGGSREGAGGAGRAGGHHRSGHVVRKAITTKPSSSISSAGKSLGLPAGSLPLLPEELHQMTLVGSARSMAISQSSPSVQGTVSGLDDSSLFSVSTTTTVVKKKP